MSSKSSLAKALIKRQGKVTFCLTMIVKNESKNMVRLFESIKTIIDYISIDDTGSTDDTIEIIENWGKENKIPTTVHKTPFKNFEFNRTQAAINANKTYPKATFLFLSDADFVWVIKDFTQKFKLYHDEYHVFQIVSPDGTFENATLKNPNTRIIKNNGKWKCHLYTHELWKCEKSTFPVPIDWLYIDDKNDGGAKSDKYERDERLCKQGLKDSNVEWEIDRYTFYLAQTLRDVGKYDESLIYYKRSALKQNSQAQYAKYQCGALYELLGYTFLEVAKLMCKDKFEPIEIEYIKRWNPNGYSPEIVWFQGQSYFDDAELYYIKAYKNNRRIIDPLYKVVVLFRQRGKLEDALKWGKELVESKIKNDDESHFIDPSIYTYKRYIEYCLVCLSLRCLDEVDKYLNILFSMNLPKDDENLVFAVNDGVIAYRNREYWKIPNITYMGKTTLLRESMLSTY